MQLSASSTKKSGGPSAGPSLWASDRRRHWIVCCSRCARLPDRRFDDTE